MLNAILNFAKGTSVQRSAPKADPAPAGDGSGLSTQPAAAVTIPTFAPIDAFDRLVFARNPGLRKELRSATDALFAKDAEFEKHLTGKVDSSYFAVKGRYKDHLRKAITGGADFSGLPSLEESLLSAEQQRKWHRWQMVRVSDEARPIAGEICKRYAAAAAAAADQLEAEDRARASELGIPYEQSGAIRALRQIEWRASERIGLPGMPVRPRAMLPFDLAKI